MLNKPRTIPKGFQQPSLHRTSEHDTAPVTQTKPPATTQVTEPSATSTPPNDPTFVEHANNPSQSASRVVDVRVKVPSGAFDLGKIPATLQKKALTNFVERARRRMVEKSDFNVAAEPTGDCAVVRSSGLLSEEIIARLKALHDPHDILSDNAICKAVLQHNVNCLIDEIKPTS